MEKRCYYEVLEVSREAAAAGVHPLTRVPGMARPATWRNAWGFMVGRAGACRHSAPYCSIPAITAIHGDFVELASVLHVQ